MIRVNAGEFRRGTATDWLALAATPTFATMAVLAGFAGHDPVMVLCSSAAGILPTGGMTAMYALMAIFHSGPWWRRFGSHA